MRYLLQKNQHIRVLINKAYDSDDEDIQYSFARNIPIAIISIVYNIAG
jgi:hypothetical protein